MRRDNWYHRAVKLLIAFGAILLGHVLVIALIGMPLALDIGKHTSFGSNGIACRFLWSQSTARGLDLDVLGSNFRFEVRSDRVFLQAPVAGLLLFLFFGVGVLWIIDRRRRRRSRNIGHGGAA